VRFLIDNQLPPALACFIDTELGCEGRHVADVGLEDASDAEAWQYALANGFVLLSKDEDFTHGSEEFERLPDLGAGRQLSRRVSPRPVRRLWPNLLERLESGDRFVEIR
jgi:predicted nuclease of predicted toxin-antitoxin system